MTTPATISDSSMTVPDELRSALRARGITEWTPVQRAVLEGELAGRDLRISSQTGSGKTVAIGLVLAPELMRLPTSAAPDRPRGPQALIIAPTRELAAQVATELRWLYAELPGVRVNVVTGGVPLEPERRMLWRGTSVLVGTPGRLLDHLRGGALVLDRLAHVVLDEADHMFDLGFREELDAIVAELPEKRSSHLVSATFPPAVSHLADRFQRDPVLLRGTQPGAAHADIDHIGHWVDAREVYPALVNLVLAMPGERTLVFVRRRVDASELAEKLAADGLAAAPFSGELAQAQRTRTLNAFRSGAIQVLVSTDVAARGLDVPELAAVVHVAPPGDAESYVHRSGRTGRAGRRGRSILLVPYLHRRKIERLLSAARVRCDWRPVPSAQTVRQLQAAYAQRTLQAGLAQAPPPNAAQLALAQQILDADAPLQTVAALVGIAAPKAPREPMDLTRAAAPRRPEQRPSRAAAEFVEFRLNYGTRAGATPGRVMAQVCRRGRIKRASVGAIRIESAGSTIQVASSVADRFELNASKPDSRDKGLRISRARQRPGSRGRQTGAAADAVRGTGPRPRRSAAKGVHRDGRSGPGRGRPRAGSR